MPFRARPPPARLRPGWSPGRLLIDERYHQPPWHRVATSQDPWGASTGSSSRALKFTQNSCCLVGEVLVGGLEEGSLEGHEAKTYQRATAVAVIRVWRHDSIDRWQPPVVTLDGIYLPTRTDGLGL